MSILKSKFGETSAGINIYQYVLKTEYIEVGILNYGGIITYLKVPDRKGIFDDIVAGFTSFQEYPEKSPFFGCIVGRVANRISNGRFNIDGNEYNIVKNNGPNSLHGGQVGFDKKIWNVEVGSNSIILRYVSADKEEGFPGELTTSVTYTVVEKELIIEYQATTTKSTPVNLTNHTYFNLSGHDHWEANLLNHKISICADEYLPTDNNCLTTGIIKPVEGSIFDLREGQLMNKERLEAVPGGGYDHNYCLTKNNKMTRAAIVEHWPSGRMMSVHTTAPGVQLYTGNFLKGPVGKNNVAYERHSAFCLETQNWPNAVNNTETFPTCILNPSEVYQHKTIFKFETM